jgi:hypothetical protein
MTERPVVLQLFTLPNTIDGRLALKLIRAGLNRKDYEIVVRNRGVNSECTIWHYEQINNNDFNLEEAEEN